MNPLGIVRQHYALNVTHSDYLGGGGGFSGAQLHRVTTSDGQTLCLRRWSKGHPTEQRLRFIHEVVLNATSQYSIPLAAPLRTTSGSTYFTHQGALWELAPWLPGTADFHIHSTSQRVQQVCSAVAEFHLASESWPSQTGVPSGLSQRLKLLKKFRTGDADSILYRLGETSPPIRQRAQRTLEYFKSSVHEIENKLKLCQSPFALQPCLRDLWHDHLLFQEDRLTGLVDYGALNYESVAADLGRLLGSLFGDDKQRWREAFDLYSKVRKLTVAEMNLAELYDEANIALSPMNWLRWLVLDNRQFDDGDAVLARLDSWIARMK